MKFLILYFRIALKIGFIHWSLDGKQLLANVLQQSKSYYAMSICVMYLVERNVSSMHTKVEQSPCESFSKPKMQHESEFSSVFLTLKSLLGKKSNCNYFLLLKMCR